MGLSSLHVCNMESSPDHHWLQGTINEEDSGMMDSNSSGLSGGDMLTCSREMAERRLRPPHDLSLKCPRCDSTHTKFCYYNNYSLSQPRYFCKTCRRYWTKGGTLRNIPVGGGCRKNKKLSSKKSNDINNIPHDNIQNQNHLYNSYNHNNAKDFQFSFPDVQFSQLSNFAGSALGNTNFMVENPRPIDFMMESKLQGIVGSDFFGNSTHDDNMNMNNISLVENIGVGGSNFHSAFGGGMSSFDDYGGNNINNGGYNNNLIDSCQRLMLPYDHEDHNNGSIDVKPNLKLLPLEWQQDQGCSEGGYGSSSLSGMNMMNGYGSSTSNPLING